MGSTIFCLTFYPTDLIGKAVRITSNLIDLSTLSHLNTTSL